MTSPIHLGFSGTRLGMTDAQRLTVMRLVEEQIDDMMITSFAGPWAHHGDCIGADAELHEIADRWLRPVGGCIVIHPGPGSRATRAFCAGDETLPVLGHMKRNAAIVGAGHRQRDQREREAAWNVCCQRCGVHRFDCGVSGVRERPVRRQVR